MGRIGKLLMYKTTNPRTINLRNSQDKWTWLLWSHALILKTGRGKRIYENVNKPNKYLWYVQ